MPRYEYRYRRPQRRRVRLHVVLFALLMVLSCLYPFVEPGLLTIEEHTLYVSNLPQNLKSPETNSFRAFFVLFFLYGVPGKFACKRCK